MDDIERLKALLTLNLTGLAGSVTHRKLVAVFGDLRTALRAPKGRLDAVAGIGPAFVKALSEVENKGLAEKELEQAERMGVAIATFDDETYPATLKNIYDPPLLLYIRGTLTPNDDLAVAMVGSRQCTPYGGRQATILSRGLAEAGVLVVSGLARGIDTHAHRGALSTPKGRTVAVLGSGLNRMYPPENKALADRIAERGALLSEFGLNVGPEPSNFPRRNRIVSGLSLGVVVVEAADRSGALITTDWALEQGKEVFCVPGPVDGEMSRGCHRMIRSGAKLIENTDDILEDLPLYAQERLGYQPKPRLTVVEQIVVDAMAAGTLEPEAIAAAKRIPLPFVEDAIARLETKGLIPARG